MDELSAMERQLGIEFPQEFRDLYSTFNGIGLTSSDATEVEYWNFLPLHMIPDFAETIRNWFRETHPDAAARFVPFYDWKNGDGLGYLFDENGIAIPGLCNFEHELYGFDEDQDLDEFLEVVPVTIKEFLVSR